MSDKIYGTSFNAEGKPNDLVKLNLAITQIQGKGTTKGLVKTSIILTDPNDHDFITLQFSHPSYVIINCDNWANYLYYTIYVDKDKSLATIQPPDESGYIFVHNGLHLGRYLFITKGTGGDATDKVIMVENSQGIDHPVEARDLDQATLFDSKSPITNYSVGFKDTHISINCLKRNIHDEEIVERYHIQFTKKRLIRPMLNVALGISYPFFAPDTFIKYDDTASSPHKKLKLVQITPEFWYLEPFDQSFKLILNKCGFQDAITAVKDHIFENTDGSQSKYDSFNQQIGQLLTSNTATQDILKLCTDYFTAKE